MRLVFKTFDESSAHNCRNDLNYRHGHYVELTSEEPSELCIPVRLNYLPPSYYHHDDPAKIVINEEYSRPYVEWKNTQAEEPDLSLLIGQYLEFWTAWNVRADALIAEERRIRLEKEAAQTVANKALIEKSFPGITQFESGKVFENWSYLDVTHNNITLVHKEGLNFNINLESEKWYLNLKSPEIGNCSDIKRSKNIKVILKFILEDTTEIKYYLGRHNEVKEQNRKSKLLHTTMIEAGWTHDYNTRYYKQKESGKWLAEAEIAADSDHVFIRNIRRVIENIKLTPHKMDISIFE